MKKLFLSSQPLLGIVVILAGIAILSASSFQINEVMAKPHASLVLVPDKADERQEHANPITLVLGHTNEPAFGKLPGIHDGKHFVEIILEDEATALPIQGSSEESDPEGNNGETDPEGNNGETDPIVNNEETDADSGLSNTEIVIDKFYFKDIESFKNADSPYQADAVEEDVPMSAVFGQPGLFYNRQVIDEGIYGYTIRGVINYYNVANVPIPEVTKFCSSQEGDTTDFDKGDWSGSFGCPTDIKDIFFPPGDGYGYGSSYGGNNNYEGGEYEYSDVYESEYDEYPKEQYQTYGEDNRESSY
jgi:hypothetical protein